MKDNNAIRESTGVSIFKIIGRFIHIENIEHIMSSEALRLRSFLLYNLQKFKYSFWFFSLVYIIFVIMLLLKSYKKLLFFHFVAKLNFAINSFCFSMNKRQNNKH